MADGASSISVAVRVRPFTVAEEAQLKKFDENVMFLGDGSLAAAPTPKLNQKGLRSVIKVVDDRCLVFDPPEDNPIHRFSKSVVPQGKKVKDQTFAFDRVFDQQATQQDVFAATAKPLLDNVLNGYNATVFAYGATGCGKTHTITGNFHDPGIIFLTMQELFDKINELETEKVCELSLSYLEIYNETIRDLLVEAGPGPRQVLNLREDANQAVSVPGLTSTNPKDLNEVMQIVVKGNERRTMSPTEANAVSSRSHAVLQINVSTKDRNADINEPHTMATLSIIDLAGSERASATKNRGERLIEGANINKSLLALGSCINALCDVRKRNHVPYRNSKLTRLLKFSLGGNCKTVMIVCVSPSSAHFDETQNTLRYANRAKNIQTKVTRNVYNVNRHVKDFLKKIDEQMTLINELKQQQKDYENVAFAKFRKQSEKREVLQREGITRLRNAYDHSSNERNERLGHMRKLRQIERRIQLISAWIAGFDNVCENREDEEPLANLLAIRKKATGIQTELESSRHHYHQRLAKNDWTRSIDTALQIGVKQLKEADAGCDAEIANLTREAELLKANADREAYMSIYEQDRTGDAAIVQVLLQAHFETVATLGQIMTMDEHEAVQAARNLLSKLINSCSEATSQVIKPDGGLSIPEAFPPTRSGTPKKRKLAATLLGPSPIPPSVRASLVSSGETSQIGSSPIKGSPRRRKIAAAKKGVSFTPKKKSPIKGPKRGVRWKDDTEDGALAEYGSPPKHHESTPESTTELPQAPLLPAPITAEGNGSSPLSTPPELSFEAKPRSLRFETGFLSKKRSTDSLKAPILPTFSSDSEPSPLREMDSNKAPFRSPLHIVENAPNASSSDQDSGVASLSSSDDEKSNSTSMNLDKSDAKKILSALKRTSSINTHNSHGVPPNRVHRRRSPTASTVANGSPPSGGENMFTASHARRMVSSERNSDLSGVLSPRTEPVRKNAAHRRTTLGGSGMGVGGHEGGGFSRGPVRMSSVAPGRGSMATSGHKSVWR